MIVVAVPVLLLASMTTAWAQVTIEQKCKAGKVSAAGKAASCTAKARAKEHQGKPPEYTQQLVAKCEDTMRQKYEIEEAYAASKGAACATVDDALTAFSFVNAWSQLIADGVDEPDNYPACGDDEVNVAGEECDGTDMNGRTCENLGFGPGTLTCDASCRYVTMGCDLP